MTHPAWLFAGGVAGLVGLRKAWTRLQLSRAKHRSLGGHARMSQRVSRLLPFYEFGADEAFGVDGADAELAARRRAGFERLGDELRARSPDTLAVGAQLLGAIPDVEFTRNYRVPFPFRGIVRNGLPVPGILDGSAGVQVRDLDGNWSYDLSGSYGCNLLGYEFYKVAIDRAAVRARELGPVLGAYHPVVIDVVRRLRAISGQDEVSFHMSGTEAVMQAVRLARYHTRRSHVVRFAGAYHGWWDGVQAGVGNPRPPHEVYTLEEGSERALHVIRTRRDIACVLVNPLQALHPNRGAPSDSTLMTGTRSAGFDREGYASWLERLRDACTANGVALILDEVFLGFRLGVGGAQDFFGVRADLVTYGKTLGGGLPVGVVCGRRAWMKRFRDDRPGDICFARGTFNAHPYVLCAMHEFLTALDDDSVRERLDGAPAVWDQRAEVWNARLEAEGLPIRVAHLVSVFTVLFSDAGRYHWMLQFYLRAEGLHLSWVGTGRFIFGHDYGDAEFGEVVERFVRAARRMRDDGFVGAPEGVGVKDIKRGVLRELLRRRSR
ncbi:MAG: aminotransferase class III-fold pyridoxal phosphate-dependent enzyme [Planctomycetota bacterium]|nr:aminotransferase class III-fold pyridoxal phosphate-dependent enzyme [Planctomycetota bacterium]MDA0934421.1 aminotransferase class III-fold pyridoxal phosphate-dependent enzyme [Planctomycetota bacterium]MDA1221486.1 aminotransferase class III-fold pyridoxal phosphate-dependent enzyme [Planctomycetota bacterium]